MTTSVKEISINIPIYIISHCYGKFTNKFICSHLVHYL